MQASAWVWEHKGQREVNTYPRSNRAPGGSVVPPGQVAEDGRTPDGPSGEETLARGRTATAERTANEGSGGREGGTCSKKKNEQPLELPQGRPTGTATPSMDPAGPGPV